MLVVKSNPSLPPVPLKLNSEPAAFEATKDIMYFRDVLEELGFKQLHPTPLYIDNKSLISMVHQPSGNHKRTRHYLLRLNFMIEQVSLLKVHLEYLEAPKQTADLLTKPLGPALFLPFRQELLGPQRLPIKKPTEDP